ncbi:MAG: glycosyltransferase family 2 protein, partial [Acidimicrobiales bacterium]
MAVTVPSFRRPHFLQRALQSVQAQRGARPARVVVVDDGSRDGTAGLARDFGAEVIEKPQNEGLSRARQDALAATEGVEWLALLDDDDQWLPHHLATVWAHRGDHVIVAGTAAIHYPRGWRAHGPSREAPEVVRGPGRLFFPENPFTTSAVLVRRDMLLAAGGFDPRLAYLEDIDAWLRVLELGTGLLLPEVTCLYSVHDAQMTQDRPAM